MSENKRVVRASSADVFAVLGDGWSYAGWVVGAARIRSVDRGFPAVRTSVHHSVGVWPLLVNDVTTVEDFEPDRRLVIKVRVWPAGAGRVEFVTTTRPDGCLLVMREEAVEGPASLLPSATVDRSCTGATPRYCVASPIWRNHEPACTRLTEPTPATTRPKARSTTSDAESSDLDPLERSSPCRA